PAVVKFAIAYFCLVNTLAMVAVWTPLIVKSFSADASNRTIGLLAAIPQVCTIVAMIWWGRRSDRLGERRWHTVSMLTLAAVALLIAALNDTSLLITIISLTVATAGLWAAYTVF
ncbi:MFS transporter, partial [Paraburkholderia sp. SIMBA_053]|uniref:MFS transporter n=1 Tax=Paraburkholderia sp. SIMBA_053 TaxID=3085794 RepID=UPI00397DD1C2